MYKILISLWQNYKPQQYESELEYGTMSMTLIWIKSK